MNGIHDMGGMHGFGPVDVDDDAIFHADWEKHACAVAELVFGAGYINLDAFRAGIETMHPALYLRSSYFERWLYAVEVGLIDRGYLTRAELEGRLRQLENGSYVPSEALPRRTPPESDVTPPTKPPAQRFRSGDRVRVRNRQPLEHTRSPRYLRGKVGTIGRCHGHEVLPDSHAHYQGDEPQVVYSVSFDGSEVWGEDADPALLLSVDLWDCYLEPD